MRTSPTNSSASLRPSAARARSLKKTSPKPCGEIRVALLEADVNLNVVNELIEHIREKAVGTEVLTALSPSEQVVKIVRDELIALLGKDTARFKFASQPPTVILMAGLQGSGKTTTSGKLAAWLKKGGHRPMLVSVDVYRPAAREQLKVVAKQAETKLYEGDLRRANPPAPRSSNVLPKRPAAKPSSWAATRSSSTPPAASTSTKNSWPRWSA